MQLPQGTATDRSSYAAAEAIGAGLPCLSTARARNVSTASRFIFIDTRKYAAVYLASDESGFVHGIVLDVDGGRITAAVIAT